MKQIELVNGIKSSVLGFGCAPILGSIDAKTAERALNIAIDSGINHLDLARSYGYGEAEPFIGKLLRDKRNKLVIASKFGIKANWKAGIIRPFKPMIRNIKKSLDNKKSEVSEHPVAAKLNNIADTFHDRLIINSDTMLTSLENSLKALKTDHLDYFFVHETFSTIENIDDLIETAEKLKTQGKIRAFGLAFMRSQENLHKMYLDKFDILQFDNSPGSDNYEETVSKRSNKANIFFSPLRGGSRELSVADKLLKLNNDFPKSVILCSMFNESHIRSNSNLFL